MGMYIFQLFEQSSDEYGWASVSEIGGQVLAAYKKEWQSRVMW